MKMKIKIEIVFLILIVGGLLSVSLFSKEVTAVCNAPFCLDHVAVMYWGCLAGGFGGAIIGSGSCVPFEPPTNRFDCNACNTVDEFGKCTEYRCKAIGETCEYIPSIEDPENEGF